MVVGGEEGRGSRSALSISRGAAAAAAADGWMKGWRSARRGDAALVRAKQPASLLSLILLFIHFISCLSVVANCEATDAAAGVSRIT